jgi:hypothetical protein
MLDKILLQKITTPMQLDRVRQASQAVKISQLSPLDSYLLVLVEASVCQRGVEDFGQRRPCHLATGLYPSLGYARLHSPLLSHRSNRIGLHVNRRG